MLLLQSATMTKHEKPNPPSLGSLECEPRKGKVALEPWLLPSMATTNMFLSMALQPVLNKPFS